MSNSEQWARNLKSENLSEKVLYQLQQAILSKMLKPGDYLPPERVMAEEMGVGKSSVREAIKMLQVLGVVETMQGKGTVIKDSVDSMVLMPLLFDLMLTQSSGHELMEFREMFEEAYMIMAMKKATDQDIKYLYELLEEHSAKEEQGNFTLDDEMQFHIALLEITRNPFVIKVGKTLMKLFLEPLAERRHAEDHSCADHLEAIQALSSHDEKKVRKCVQKMLNVYRGYLDTYNVALSEKA